MKKFPPTREDRKAQELIQKAKYKKLSRKKELSPKKHEVIAGIRPQENRVMTRKSGQAFRYSPHSRTRLPHGPTSFVSSERDFSLPVLHNQVITITLATAN